MDTEGSVGNLEEESLKRKERLKAMKSKLTSGPDKTVDTSVKSVELPK